MERIESDCIPPTSGAPCGGHLIRMTMRSLLLLSSSVCTFGRENALPLRHSKPSLTLIFADAFVLDSASRLPLLSSFNHDKRIGNQGFSLSLCPHAVGVCTVVPVIYCRNFLLSGSAFSLQNMKRKQQLTAVTVMPAYAR